MQSHIYDDTRAYEEVDVAPNVTKTIEMAENVCYGERTRLPVNNQSDCPAKYFRSSRPCSSRPCSNWLAIAMGVTAVVAIALGLIAACITFALEIDHLENEINSLQQLSKNISALEALLSGRAERQPDFPISSCAALPPSSPSGYYWVRASGGSAVRVYCDMTRSCGGATGGWMRVAQLNMTNTSHQCPSPLRESTQSNIRTCVRNESEGGCSSIVFSTNNVNYSSVCGKVIAYQHGRPEAFNGRSINSNYVDGVSLTHGTSRQHIWTFAAARDEEVFFTPENSCPCIRNDLVDRESAAIPSFVREDYFCDTGSQSNATHVLYSDDPLWDGAGCGPESTCCSFNTPPWFYRQLPHTTTDDIELRVCRDAIAFDEDIAIQTIDLYIKI